MFIGHQTLFRKGSVQLYGTHDYDAIVIYPAKNLQEWKCGEEMNGISGIKIKQRIPWFYILQ